MNKLLLVFGVGIIETFLYTCYLISVEKRKALWSSVLMFTYMSIYLSIISFAIKDVDSVYLILIYAFSCGIGNFLRIYYAKKAKKN